MSDYISREAAKQILSRMLPDNAAECACNLIDSVLPADVEPVRRIRLTEGEEQYVEEFGWFRWVRCLNCYSGFDITGHPRYCPYCGGKVVWDGVTEAEAKAEIRATRAEQEAASEMEDSSVNFDDFFASFEDTDQVDGNQTDPESDHSETEETTLQDSDGPEDVQMDLEDENGT